MPFFSNKFSPKKTPPRKRVSSNDNIDELFEENHEILLDLVNFECNFKNGDWNTENGSKEVSQRNTQRLKNRIQELEEENNLLKLKYSILINMLTQFASQYNIKIERLK